MRQFASVLHRAAVGAIGSLGMLELEVRDASETFASDGLGLISVGPDPAPNACGSLAMRTLPWQSTWIELDRRDAAGDTLFVGQGSADVARPRICWPALGG